MGMRSRVATMGGVFFMITLAVGVNPNTLKRLNKQDKAYSLRRRLATNEDGTTVANFTVTCDGRSCGEVNRDIAPGAEELHYVYRISGQSDTHKRLKANNWGQRTIQKLIKKWVKKNDYRTKSFKE